MNNPLVQPDPGLAIWTIVTFLVLYETPPELVEEAQRVL
jgi:hypothetical protein